MIAQIESLGHSFAKVSISQLEYLYLLLATAPRLSGPLRPHFFRDQTKKKKKKKKNGVFHVI
jgi:hypothetical protein